MMRKILILLLFIPTYSFSQEFTFQLVIEDAIGNRDSIVLGYDSDATEGIDTIFNEIDISSIDWDTTLDVRAINRSLIFPHLQYKYSITKKGFNQNCFYASHQFAVLTNHWPIKISWDSTAFNTLCPQNIQLSNRELLLNYDHSCWSDDNMQFTDMRSISSVIYETATPEYGMCFWEEDENIPDSSKFCFVQFSNGLNVKQMESIQFKLSPNPTSGILYLELQENKEYDLMLTDLQGKVVYASLLDYARSDRYTVDVSGFANGIYLLTLQNEEQSTTVKIVVQH